MNTRKVFLSLCAISAIGVASYASLTTVQAQSQETYSPVLTRLIEKFNLNTSEVDAIVREVRSERQEEMRKNIEERLQAEVEKGNLTSEQKDKIILKLQEHHNENEKVDMRTLTPEERREQMTERRTEMTKWAEENGIEIEYIMGLGRDIQGNGYGRGMHQGRDF